MDTLMDGSLSLNKQCKEIVLVVGLPEMKIHWKLVESYRTNWVDGRRAEERGNSVSQEVRKSDGGMRSYEIEK